MAKYNVTTMKRKYPLFIIDDSRSHGKSRETDYISCTSTECGFVAEAIFLTREELSIDRDWQFKNDFSVYSEEINGIRIKIKAIHCEPTVKTAQVKSLLKKALKEYLKRRTTAEVNTEDIKNSDIVKFCDILLGQEYENLRENPDDSQARMIKAILTKIKNDYNNE